MACAGVTIEWRLLRQSWTIPGWADSWHAKHSAVASLIGASIADARVNDKSEHDDDDESENRSFFHLRLLV